VPGADLNPYIGIAALLASALDGIDAGLDPGPPATGDAYTPESVLALPPDLSRAAQRFAASGFARRAFGDAVVDHYAAVAQYEWAQFQAAVTDWERTRYFELI
jgi:glutamine synthetase